MSKTKLRIGIALMAVLVAVVSLTAMAAPDNNAQTTPSTTNDNTSCPMQATYVADDESSETESKSANEAADIEEIAESVFTVDTENGEIKDENGNVLGYVGEDGLYTLTDEEGSPIVITVDPEPGSDGSTVYSITEAE